MSNLPERWNYWLYHDDPDSLTEAGREDNLFIHTENNGADYEKWAQLPWNAEQATALLFGKDPDRISSEELAGNVGPFAKYYSSVLELVTDAQNAGALPQIMSPSMVLAWAKRVGIDIPPDLAGGVEKIRATILELEEKLSELQERYDAIRIERNELRYELETQRGAAGNTEKPLGQRERSTLQKIIMGMALIHYRYNRSAARNASAREMSQALELKGLRVSEDTLSNVLSAARELAED